MNRHIIPFSATLFALVMGATSASQPVKALQAEPVLAAESCVVYKPDGQGGYRLANTCDYNVDIAFCTQPSNDPGLCLRTQNYTRETLKAKSEGVQKVWPEQALDLFACRAPGTVEILPSGLARCNPQSAQPMLPWLVSASLKNPGSVVLASDYQPRDYSKEGTSRFELIVGSDGKPESCSITVSSGHDVLDQAACNAFIKRAKFSPAKDAAGNPVAGRYKGSVTWKAP